MNDELTKPLGLKPQKPKDRMRPAFVVLALLVVATAGFAAFHTLDRQPDTIAQAPVAPQEAPARPAGSAPAASEPEPGPAVPVDDGGPALAEAEPEGSIEAKVPGEPLRQEAGLAHLPDPDLSERGDDGVLPKRAADGRRPMDVYSRPPAREGNLGVARVVLIIGGLGISQTGSQQALKQLPPSVTLAFAPYGNSLLRWMQQARRKGHELLLQVPMEPFGGGNPGPHTLSTAQDAATNLADLHWSMSRITNYVGIVNFLGGKFITEPEALKPVFQDIATRGLLFVDDGSIRNSVAGEVAKGALLPFAKAAVQIDANRSRAAIAKQLNALAEEAKRTGVAIGIANAFPESIDAIARFAAGANAAGIEITPVSAIVSDPERKR